MNSFNIFISYNFFLNSRLLNEKLVLISNANYPLVSLINPGNFPYLVINVIKFNKKIVIPFHFMA